MTEEDKVFCVCVSSCTAALLSIQWQKKEKKKSHILWKIDGFNIALPYLNLDRCRLSHGHRTSGRRTLASDTTTLKRKMRQQNDKIHKATSQHDDEQAKRNPKKDETDSSTLLFESKPDQTFSDHRQCFSSHTHTFIFNSQQRPSVPTVSTFVSKFYESCTGPPCFSVVLT